MKMKYERNCGYSEEYFWGSREHGAQFLGTWELSKGEFRGPPYFIFEEQGNTCQFLKGTRGHAPPPPPPWEAIIFPEGAKMPFSLSLRATHSLETTTRQSLFVLFLWVFNIVRLCTSQY